MFVLFTMSLFYTPWENEVTNTQGFNMAQYGTFIKDLQGSHMDAIH